MLTDVFVKFADRYQASNILCITEGQYHFKDRNKVNCFKMPPCWEFDGSYERGNTISTMFYSLLNHLGNHLDMDRHLKTFKFK